MADPDPYELSPQQLRERFDTKVVDYVFARRQPSDHPVAILTGAQPAAGKTLAMTAVSEQNADCDVIRLSGDELRQFHPKYHELMATDPIAMVPATQQASTAWMQMAFDHAVEHGYSFVAEGTFRNPQAVLADARFFATGQRDEGSEAVPLPAGRSRHEVWILALAVRDERSRLDALHRFLAPGEDAGRWVWPEWAKASYDAIPSTVAAAEASPHVHRVIVTNRSGVDLYVNTRRPDGAMEHPPASAEAVLAERARPLPVHDADGWLTRQQDVIQTFVATGQVDPTTYETLSITIADAQTVIPMSSSAAGRPFLDAQAVQSRLDQLLRWAHEGPQQQRPVVLVPDAVIDARLNRPDTRQNALRAAELRSELDRRAALGPALRAAEDSIRASAQSLAGRRRDGQGGVDERVAGELADGPARAGTETRTASTPGQRRTAETPETRHQDRPPDSAQADPPHPYGDMPDAELAATLGRTIEAADAARRQAADADGRAEQIAAALLPGGEVERHVAGQAERVDAILRTRADAAHVDRLTGEVDRTRREISVVEERLAERGGFGRPAVRGAEREALEQRLSDLRSAAQNGERRLATARNELDVSARASGDLTEHDAVLKAWQESGGDPTEVLARATAARERGLDAARSEAQDAQDRAAGLDTAVGRIRQELDRRSAQPPGQRAAEDARRVQAARRAAAPQQVQQPGAAQYRGRSGPSR